MPINEFLLRQHDEYQNDKKSSENKCTSLYSFDWADGTEICLKPAVSSVSLAFWQFNAFTFHAHNLFSKQHSVFVYFYSIRMRQIQSVFLKTKSFRTVLLSFSLKIEKLWKATEGKKMSFFVEGKDEKRAKKFRVPLTVFFFTSDQYQSSALNTSK